MGANAVLAGGCAWVLALLRKLCTGDGNQQRICSLLPGMVP